MKHEGSLQQAQQSATWPYSEPDQTSPCLHSTYLTIHFNIILTPTPRFNRCHMPQAQYTYLKSQIIIIIIIINTAHVERKNKGDTSNNRGDWDYFKDI